MLKIVVDCYAAFSRSGLFRNLATGAKRRVQSPDGHPRWQFVGLASENVKIVVTDNREFFFRVVPEIYVLAQAYNSVM